MDELKKYRATKVSQEMIELVNVEQLANLWKTIEEERNFILQWTEGNVNHSKLMIGNNLTSKVKNGDLELTAKESKGD